MINQRTFMILFACGLILQNVDPVKGQGVLGKILGTVSELVGAVLEVPKDILELTGPLTGPSKKTFEEICGTAQKGLPLNQTQVQKLLDILNVSSILELGDGGLKKISKVFNVTQILEVEQEFIVTTTPCIS